MSAQKHKAKEMAGAAAVSILMFTAIVPLARFSIREKAIVEAANKVQKVRQICYNRSTQ